MPVQGMQAPMMCPTRTTGSATQKPVQGTHDVPSTQAWLSRTKFCGKHVI